MVEKKMEWNGIVWRIKKVEKNKKIKWNEMVGMGGANKWLSECISMEILNRNYGL